ncbi:MAG: FAD-binding oxidoreductase [Hyphomicrobiales bacterium]|nr:FAD-binding oxidoreductase [Hyphomicrobiales bacterium]
MSADIFHADYREFPFWWEAYAPHSDELTDIPRDARVAIIGAGYAGLATALELSKLGIDAVVLDAESPGYGASTRSGGLVGGTASVKKPLIAPAPDSDHAARMTSDAGDGLKLLERLIDEEKIDCGWHKTGRFTGAWSKSDFHRMKADAEKLNSLGGADARVVAPEDQRGEIGSDFYYGGLLTGEAGHLHPALYFQGLLDACQRRGVAVCAKAPVETLQQDDAGWLVKTSRGDVRVGDVVIATNGYTGGLTPQFQRRLIPLQPYIIATETLPADLAKDLSPKNRSFADSRRIVTFFRLSSDGKRMVFGSRVKWRDMTPSEMAPLLYDVMIERYPQLEGTRITHAWTGNVALTLDEQPHLGRLDGLHYALGCNGSGVAMMTYLGTQLARKIAGQANYQCAYDTGEFATHPLYNGRSRWFLPVIGNYLKMRDWIDRRWR